MKYGKYTKKDLEAIIFLDIWLQFTPLISDILVCRALTITLGRIWYHYFLSQICISICFTWTCPFFTAIAVFGWVHIICQKLILVYVLLPVCLVYSDIVCDRSIWVTAVLGKSISVPLLHNIVTVHCVIQIEGVTEMLRLFFFILRI